MKSPKPRMPSWEKLGPYYTRPIIPSNIHQTAIEKLITKKPTKITEELNLHWRAVIGKLKTGIGRSRMKNTVKINGENPSRYMFHEDRYYADKAHQQYLKDQDGFDCS